MVGDDRFQTCPGCGALLSGGEHLVKCWVAFQARLVRKDPRIKSLPNDDSDTIKRVFDMHTGTICDNRDPTREAALIQRRDDLVFLVARELVEQMVEREEREREATAARRLHQRMAEATS